MNHLDYYQFQAKARNVHSLQDVERIARVTAQRHHQLLHSWLPSDRTAPVGELACGHGSFLWWLHDRGYTHVTGIDSSPEQIALARQVTGVTVIQADVNSWLVQQPESSWQTLFGIDLIEHLPKDDFMTLLAGAYRALRPGGRLILRYPNGDSPVVGLNLFNDVTHVWTYTSNCMTSLSQMHGYTRARFVDESSTAICDQRWLKVPLCKISQAILGVLFRAAAKEGVPSWSPNLWACLEK